MRASEIRYARLGDDSVAYRVLEGARGGEHDVILVGGGTMSMEAFFDDTVFVRVLEGLSDLGRLILFGYAWALMHHMLGGIRHLIWDTGRGFGPHEREWLAMATLVGSISLTVLIWIVGYLFMGGSR